jgi:hypothetical protein
MQTGIVGIKIKDSIDLSPILINKDLACEE